MITAGRDFFSSSFDDPGTVQCFAIRHRSPLSKCLMYYINIFIYDVHVDHTKVYNMKLPNSFVDSNLD